MEPGNTCIAGFLCGRRALIATNIFGCDVFSAIKIKPWSSVN
jgi:hypothetical protein